MSNSFAPSLTFQIKPFTMYRVVKALKDMSGNYSLTTHQDGSSDMVTQDGFHLQWSYYEKTEEFNLRCMTAPSNYTPEDVNKRLTDLVKSKIVAL